MARLLPLTCLFGLVVVGTVQAQTCAGVLALSFYDVDYETREVGRYVIPIRSLGVTAEFFHGETAGTPTADEARRDPALELRAREVLAAYPRLFVGGTEVALAPQCGLELLHLVVEYRHETMTLDVYRIPSHIGMRLDGPVPFRPGRYILDLATAERLPSDTPETVYAASAVRPAGEAPRRE